VDDGRVDMERTGETGGWGRRHAIASATSSPDRAGPDRAGPDRVAVGDLTDLFRAHHLELVRLALMITGDLATAEDVVQDVFERLYRRRPNLRNEGAGLAYARASVLNGCRSVHRRTAIGRRYAGKLAAVAQDRPDVAVAAADRGGLAEALRVLPARQREVVVLRYYCDLDVAEIAAMLRIEPGSVRSTMSRALDALGRTVRRDEQ
jgi:RNA polymerase sigma-70 factor (sigma-E family)